MTDQELTEHMRLLEAALRARAARRSAERRLASATARLGPMHKVPADRLNTKN